MRRPGAVTGCAFNGRSQDRAFANVSLQSFDTGNPHGWAPARQQAGGGPLSPRYEVNAPRTWMRLTYSLDTQRLARQNT